MAPTTRSQACKRKATEFLELPTNVQKRGGLSRQNLVEKSVNGDPTLFPLLSLPRELRDNIYRKIFEGGIRIGHPHYNDSKRGLSVPPIGLDLALSCKQVFLEVKESLIINDAMTICPRMGMIDHTIHYTMVNLLKQIPAPLVASFYARGIRVRFEKNVNSFSRSAHHSHKFVTMFLIWSSSINNWVVETNVDIRYPVWHRSRMQEQLAGKAALKEVKNWQYSLNEFRRASCPGEWECVLEGWKWTGDWTLRVTTRCRRTVE